MSSGYIYKVSFTNGKHYIGITTRTIEQRRKEHYYCVINGDARCLYNALRKYDMVDTFELIVIDTADTLEELFSKETRYIQEYNSYYINGKGYNMTYGGDGLSGYQFTEEDKLKMSETAKRHWENPEAREQMSNIKKTYFENPQNRQEQSERIQKYYEYNPEAGKEHGKRLAKYYEDNPEARQRQSELSTKQWEDPIARQQMSEIKKQFYEDHPDAGKEHGEKLKQYYEDNPEARQQMSDIKKKQFEDNPEMRKKLSEAQKKRFENPEARQKNIDAQKKYWESPEARQAQSERITNAMKNNPEIQKKMSERVKKMFEDDPDIKRRISDIKGQNKPFDIFTKDGTFIKTFTYQFDAKEYLQKEYNVSVKNISMVLSGKRTISNGFVFKYK